MTEEEKFRSFEKAVKPVMKWLAENKNPHTKVIIENNRAELIEGICSLNSNEFVDRLD